MKIALSFVLLLALVAGCSPEPTTNITNITYTYIIMGDPNAGAMINYDAGSSRYTKSVTRR